MVGGADGADGDADGRLLAGGQQRRAGRSAGALVAAALAGARAETSLRVVAGVIREDHLLGGPPHRRCER